MSQTNPNEGVLLVQMTVPDRETADSIAHALIEKQLAACVSIVPGLTSIYRWEGEICKDAELLLLIKTVHSCFDLLKDVVIDLHPYDLPEIIGLDVCCGLEGYLEWIGNEVQSITKKNQENKMIQVASPAPDFKLEGVMPDGSFGEIKLTDYRGKWVVLFFYPLDFTFVCPTEITGFSKRIDEFRNLNAEILGASIDSKFSHLAWINGDLGKIAYPLLSDLTKQISREYGVLLEDAGIALRGTFIIDPEGKLMWQVVHDTSIGRSVDETLRVLKALQSGELCPVDWDEGKETLGKA